MGNISDVAPTLEDLLGDCHDGPSSTHDNPGDDGHTPTLEMQAEIRQTANTWIAQAARQGACVHTTPSLSLEWEPRGEGIAEVVSLNTATLDDSIHEDMRTGIVMLDLFGGIGAGLEALLWTSTVIKRYIYVDKQAVAQRVMAARLEELHEHYPRQLPRSAFIEAFITLPQDATRISSTALTLAGATDEHVRWVVVAGWPCQDFSPAGYRCGLDGVHVGAYHAMLHILGTLQRMQPNRPPAYLLENGPIQLAMGSKNNLERNFNRIKSQIGEPVLLDAARFGARAYRLRNWWTNLIHQRCVK